MGIECEREPAFAYWAWRLRLVLMLAWVLVDLLAGYPDLWIPPSPAESKTPSRGHRPPSVKIHSPSFQTPRPKNGCS